MSESRPRRLCLVGARHKTTTRHVDSSKFVCICGPFCPPSGGGLPDFRTGPCFPGWDYLLSLAF